MTTHEITEKQKYSFLLQHIHDGNAYCVKKGIEPPLMSSITKKDYVEWCNQRNEKPIMHSQDAATP